ncbi:MAG: hypothetical protein E4H36_03840 [Spirochaetales bacterium]|nr:MAG: hypothetical protein E4H36_03840 [Spirochaetales bacterium]
MKSVLHHFSYLLRGVKVFALIGKSGTGKSFRAKLVAEKHGIGMIIDDGLLISEDRILAGRSAKKEKIYLSAVKTALFDDPLHRMEVTKALKKESFKRLLIIGTSEGMAKKIAERLDLPPPSRFIRIEEIATEDEIKQAVHSRNTEGKHVIPVPAIEIKRNYPHIFYDTIKVFLKKRMSLKKNSAGFEKSVVRTEFNTRGKVSLSEAALAQMVMHCTDEFDNQIKISKVTVQDEGNSYRMHIQIHVPYGYQLVGNIYELQQYILNSIEKHTGILIKEINITIDKIK